MAITLNRIECRKCGDVITSTHRHDFVWCSCKSVAVDGENSYLKRSGNPDNIIELSAGTDTIDDNTEPRAYDIPPVAQVPKLSRAEHLAWCKKRAIDYANTGDDLGAFASMASDMAKHPDTKDHPAIKLWMEMLSVGMNPPNGTIEFIKGFN